MDSLFKNIVIGIVRHLVTAGGAYLVSEGVITSSQQNDLLGSALFLAGVAWSAYEKYKTHKTA